MVASDKSLSIGGKLSTRYISAINSVFQTNTADQFISVSDSFTLQALNGKKLFKAGISGDTGLYHQGTQKLATNVSGISILNNASGVGGTITALDGNFTGNVSIGGTLTYEDVTNIDSVGLVTARSGIRVTGGVIEAQAGENKIPSLYANLAALPSASTYHGMFAHVHSTGRGYFAHAGNWFESVSYTHLTLPTR